MSKKKYVSNEISKLHNVDEIENLVKSMKNYIAGAVKQIRTRIRLLAQPKSMRSIIDATQREQQHGSA